MGKTRIGLETKTFKWKGHEVKRIDMNDVEAR